jgi:DNA-binding transcriptional LysR family regulator
MVAAAGSTLAASRRLRITQPAVCYSLNRLETALGMRLFERNASGSYPSQGGQLLYNRTTRLFSQIVEAIRHVLDPAANGHDKSDALAWKLREIQIHAIINIWRTGTFRSAACELGIAEPSLQRPARELERLLRVSLYRRTATGLEVNATGAELARRLSLALGEIRCAVEEMDAAVPMTSANLRVGVLALAPRRVIADAAVTLLANRPRQRIDVVEASYAQLVHALRSGDIDVIFGALRIPPTYDDVIEEQLFEDPYVLVCGANHPLARATRITPRQLAKYDFVFPSRGLPRRAVLDQMLAQWSIRPKACIETSCLATIVALLRGSERISLLSRWHVGNFGFNDLHCLNVPGARFAPRFVGVTTRSQWLPTPMQREFVELVRRLV